MGENAAVDQVRFQPIQFDQLPRVFHELGSRRYEVHFELRDPDWGYESMGCVKGHLVETEIVGRREQPIAIRLRLDMGTVLVSGRQFRNADQGHDSAEESLLRIYLGPTEPAQRISFYAADQSF
jgi:hypothetical protein